MKPILLVSGISSTQDLPELLLDKFVVAVWHPDMAHSKAQKYGDKIINVSSLLNVEMQEDITNEASTVFAQEGKAVLDSLPDSKPWMPAVVLNSLVRQLSLRRGFTELCKIRKPVAIVVHEDVTETYRSLVLLGQEARIPTIHLPHNNYFMTEEYSPDIHEETICDYVIGTPHMIDFFKAHGYGGEALIMGSPILDKCAKWNPSAQEAKAFFELEDKPVVSYFTSWGQTTNVHDDLSIFDQGFEAMLDAYDDTFHLLIKMNPGEPAGTEQKYGMAAAQRGVRALLVGRAYVDKVLAASDVAVSVTPTNLSVDAATIGVTLAYLKTPGFRIGHGIPELGLGDLKQYIKERPIVDHTDLLAHDRGDIVESAKTIAAWLKENFG